MLYIPRPYQLEAIDKAFYWLNDGFNGVLLVSPTGTGKTIIFAGICEVSLENNYRVLILIDREELASQAMNKIFESTGIECSLEKGQSCSLSNGEDQKKVTVGSVQSLTELRLMKFPRDWFDYIITDEAHKAGAKTYKTIFEYFPKAKRIGLTATDHRNDGQDLISENLFPKLAFRYLLPEAIKDAWLVPIMALTIPIKIDYSKVEANRVARDSSATAEITLQENATALDPYLDEIVEEICKICKDRKTVIFLPLIATSLKMKALFEAQGVNVFEVSCKTENRKEILKEFDKAPPGAVILNAMLLTVGWDCESLDCVIILRNTKSWVLYMQMLGRGLRPYLDQLAFNTAPDALARKKIIAASSKKDLLLIDFLYNIQKVNLCRPPSIFNFDEKDTIKFEKSVELLESESIGKEIDLMELDKEGDNQATIQREENLAKALEEKQNEKKRMINGMELFTETFKDELVNFKPTNAEEAKPIGEIQQEILESNGINPDTLNNSGEAQKLIDVIDKRKEKEMASPKQIRLLKRKGFKDTQFWTHSQAQKIVRCIAMNQFIVPKWIKDPKTYIPES